MYHPVVDDFGSGSLGSLTRPLVLVDVLVVLSAGIDHDVDVDAALVTLDWVDSESAPAGGLLRL